MTKWQAAKCVLALKTTNYISMTIAEYGGVSSVSKEGITIHNDLIQKTVQWLANNYNLTAISFPSLHTSFLYYGTCWMNFMIKLLKIQFEKKKIHMYTRVNCMNSITCTCTIINVQCIKEQSETRKSKTDFWFIRKA